MIGFGSNYLIIITFFVTLFSGLICSPVLVAGVTYKTDFTAVSSSGWPPEGRPSIFPVTRDTWVSTVGKEKFGNNGGSSRLKVKGRQEYTLFDIECEQLKGKRITGALIHLRSSTPDNAPLARVGVSSVASEWVEGTSSRYKPQKGSASYLRAAHDKKDWSYPGSTILDVVFGNGHTVWRFADCSKPDKKGWQVCAVDPLVVAARVAEISNGFCLFDDLGSVWEGGKKFKYNLLPNRFMYSRESWTGRPWMEVWVDGEDEFPPEPVRDVEMTYHALPPGEAIVSWITPKDNGGGRTLGFHVTLKYKGVEQTLPRYLIPMAGQPGETVKMHIRDLKVRPGEKIGLSVRPVDDAGNMGRPFTKDLVIPSTEVLVPVPKFRPAVFAPDVNLPVSGKLKISVIDMLDKVDPTTGKILFVQADGYKGGNHIFNAKEKMIHLNGGRNEHIGFQVNLDGRTDQARVIFDFDDKSLMTKVFEFGYVKIKDPKKKSGAFKLPDPLIPLVNTFSIPSNTGKVRIENQTNHSLVCEVYIPHKITPGKKKGRIRVISDGESLEFGIDLKVWNFTLPDKLSFIPEMNAYGRSIPIDSYEYYRLAHEHRTCLNRLPYGWKGEPYSAPEWKDNMFDWEEWDELMGPLFTGTAFNDLPRRGKPVDVYYLPFNENWPVRVRGNYMGSYWADEAFKPGYVRELSKAFRAFADHIEEKSWYNTRFQFYLNNKVYYRSTDSDSMAPWIFDEPENTQDFWALRWYGKLWHSAVDTIGLKSQLEYRCDISYGELKRNILDGIMDVEYVGGNNLQVQRMRQEATLKKSNLNFVEYGSANSIDKSNLQPVIWSIRAWSNNAIGVLPWQTIGRQKDWITGARTALFYPYTKGPVPSIRLKAFRRGQQDIEYLTLLSKLYDIPRYAIPQILMKMLGTKSFQFETVSSMDLWQFRMQLIEMIEKKYSECKRILKGTAGQISKEATVLPNIGYAVPSPFHKRIRPNCEEHCF